MPTLVQTYKATGGGATEVGRIRGRAYFARSGFIESKEMFPPFGVAATALRPSRAIYRNRVYQAGSYNQNVLVDEHRRFLRQGLPAPARPPTISVGAGSTQQVAFIAFYDKLTNEWGPLSGASQSVTGNTTRSWSNLPPRTPEDDFVFDGLVTLGASSTTIPGTNTRFSALRPGDKLALSATPSRFGTIANVTTDIALTTQEALLAGANQTITVRLQPRASHIGLFVSVNGALPRLAEMRQLGVTTASESVATLALGLTLESFERIPRCSINVVWHDRQVMAGDEKHPDILYFSQLFFPERWAGFSLPTRNGEPIVALIPLRDILLVLTPDTSYVVTGYTEDDIEMNISDGQLGGFNHSANRIIHGRAWIPNRKGVYVFDGAWHNVILDRVSEWQTAYEANRTAFERGYSVDDESNNEFKFCPNAADVWIASYDTVIPEVGGNMGQPIWCNDSPTDADWQEYIKDPTSGIGKLYYGRCDGRVYQEDENVDPGIQGELITRHQYFGDPGGFLGDGKTLSSFWSYVESELSIWRVEVYGGDEYAARLNYQNLPPPLWKDDMPAGAFANPVDTDYAAKTVWPHRPTRTKGRGFSFRYTTSGRMWKWRGLGGIYGPGIAGRVPIDIAPA